MRGVEGGLIAFIVCGGWRMQLIAFEGEMLLQGAHDHVDVIVL